MGGCCSQVLTSIDDALVHVGGRVVVVRSGAWCVGAWAALGQPGGVLAPGAPRQVPLPGGNVLVLSGDGEKRIKNMVCTTTVGKKLISKLC